MAKNKNLLVERAVKTPINALLEASTTDLSEEIVEKQEHLSVERLKNLTPILEFRHFKNRPTANLIDLMHWVNRTFSLTNLQNYGEPASNPVKNNENLQCFIHNKIVIDGAFLQFCEENDVKITCLMRDSIASWKTEHDSEHFMMQGIFQISAKKSSCSSETFDFLHCALFHKGNQNEDEVSFFVVASDEVYEDYVSLRNKFDKWLIARDRDHLEVHVVGGEGYPYTRDLKWDDLFLPDDLKNDIRSSIEGFLTAKEIYESAKVPWKRGILLYGEPGNGKTSLIKTIISQYKFKPVTVQSGAQTNDDTITDAFEYAQHQDPGLLYIEDLDSMLGQTISLSHFLNMMDGIATRKGMMVIATANNLGLLKESVVDRPSRFDRKWEIPLPNEEMTLKYLQKWYGDILKPAEYKKIIAKTVENKFSYAYLKELYLSSVFAALADGRTYPMLSDINKATKQMLHDKENAKHGFETTGKEEIGFV